jgi:hypothetical protein
LAIKAHLLEVKEGQEMTTLFPTFTGWLQRAKRFLATDSRDIWQRLYEDDQRYQQDLQAKGIDYLLSI